jgi:hypothetical protein
MSSTRAMFICATANIINEAYNVDANDAESAF